ncbi:MAG TPA: lanthionine synthetase LanC family protein [Polyangiaceae bacterium]|nr:lanthionine synthetase LanC family protein [Polyangiaceae bacterium]
MTTISEQLLTLPEDVLLIPVHELAPGLRASFEHADDDVAVTRPGARTPSRLVGASGASLLREFRTPSRIIDAILRFSRGAGVDPEVALNDAFPLLDALVSSRTLVAADSEQARPIAATLSAGDSFEGFTVRRTLQVFEDCEVHQAEAADGTLIALKLGRPGYPASLAHMMQREQAVLKHLGGQVAPELLAAGEHDGRPFLALSWCPGEPITALANRLRSVGGADALPKLHALCVSLVAAYAKLHRSGVVHGDVHPDNVLADPHGNLRVIDFGIARYLDPNSIHGTAAQGGVPYFFDPRTALFLLDAGPAADGDPRDEQYRVAVLAYLLLTGQPYLRFAAERSAFLRQIAEQPPQSFASVGFVAWPAVEQVLQRALAKDRELRFPDTVAFLEALQRVPAHPPTARAVGPSGRALLARVLTEVELDAALFAAGPVQAPRCSVNLGGGGVAYFLYRLSLLRDDARLLAHADAWSLKNLERANTQPGAFENPDLDMTRSVFSECSLHHDRPGLHLTQMLISQAMADPATLRAQLPAFIHCASRAAPQRDLTLGSSGALLAAALLLEAVRFAAIELNSAVREFTRDRLETLWAELEALPPIREAQDFPLLGIAHGWAGALYAVLSAARALDLPPPSKLEQRLHELAEFAVPQSQGTAFCGNIPGARVSAMQLAPGWCAGAAGHAFLWAEAATRFGDARWLSLAEQCAIYAVHHPDRYGDLCCGLAGRAQAALRLHQLSGDPSWLTHARTMAETAAETIDRHALRAESLYRGRYGVALLQAEIEHPELAAMPIFGFEHRT